MELFELFTRESWTEISITRLDQFQSLVCEPGRQLTVTTHATSSAGHTKRTAFTVTSKKTAALSVADTKVLGRTTRCDATFDDVLYNLNPVDLFQSKHS
ncbi:hypothetical protein ABY52_22325 [Klebsiella pneumoniae]|nr:hypothetical protein ABY52_22325 [Klebsiella pneumoniae]OKB62732.1 hypothetical protein A9F06_29170 [Klebsiella pneumoniae]